MAHRTERECLNKVLDLSGELIGLTDMYADIEMDVRCRVVLGAARDHGYALRKIAEREAARFGEEEGSAAEHGVSREAAAASFSSTPSGDARTVLIVDDDRDLLKFLRLLFEDHGFKTLTAVNGHEAMEAALAEKPDLITLDISMPEKSGVSTYRDLKKEPETARIPIIIVTAIGEPFNAFIKRRRQVPDPDGFIAKPIDTEELLKAVEAVLG